MSFSRNTASYSPRPRLRSQTTTSMMAPTIGGGVHHLPGQRGCPGWRRGCANMFTAGIEANCCDGPVLSVSEAPKKLPQTLPETL